MKQNTQKLEKKIKSIDKIFKISKAMKIISSMNIKKIQPKIKENKIVIEELKKTLSIIYYLKKLKLPVKKQKESLKKITRIIFSSDLGLCGGYNNDLLQYVLGQHSNNDDLIVIGKKGINFFKYHNKKVNWSIFNEEFDFKKIEELVNYILVNQKNTKFNLVYVGIEEQQKTIIKEIQFFPFEELKNINIVELEFYKIEPNVETILEKSINFYLKILLTKIKDETKYTEEINRRFAMETASDNAKEMKSELKLKYNQLRQEKITKEIINISQSE